jgi:ankyrin repeat protein
MNINSASLIDAIERCDVLGVKYLIEKGVDVNQSCTGELTDIPLDYAVAYNCPEIVRLVLNAGAKPHSFVVIQVEPSNENESIVIETVRYLIEAGIDIDYPLEENETLLMKAASRGCLELVKFLVEAGANLNARNQCGENPLLNSIRNKEIYDYLSAFYSREERKEAERELHNIPPF